MKTEEKALWFAVGAVTAVIADIALTAFAVNKWLKGNGIKE